MKYLLVLLFVLFVLAACEAAQPAAVDTIPVEAPPVQTLPIVREVAPEPVNDTCGRKCSVTEVTLRTGDNEVYYFRPGKGTYTAAGAIDWKLLEMPSYCGEPIIPLYVGMYTYGKLVQNETVLLQKGIPSKLFQHPLIKNAALVLTAENITESCE